MKKARASVVCSTMLIALVAVIAFATENTAEADEWVTPKNPKHGYRLLGRVILMIEIREDGTVKKAWPAKANTHTRAAWRAAHAAQELTFPPGSERIVKVPVTVYLN